MACLFFTGLFQRTHACINRKTFMDHITGTMFLYNLVVQCNTKNAVCNARIALRDMGAHRVQNTTQ